MNLCIIPARGGSKRIPKKNIKEFHGKPIIAYSIEVAKESGCFDRIIVSTDDSEIAEVAIKYGAEVPVIRSKKSSDDYATLHDVALEVIGNISEEIELVALILATAPLLKTDTIKRSVTSLKGDVDSTITVVEYEMHPNKALGIEDNGFIQKLKPECLKLRSQEQPVLYHDAAQVYTFKGNDIFSRKTLTGSNCKAIIINRLESQDIDVMDDWIIAEIKHKLQGRV